MWCCAGRRRRWSSSCASWDGERGGLQELRGATGTLVDGERLALRLIGSRTKPKGAPLERSSVQPPARLPHELRTSPLTPSRGLPGGFEEASRAFFAKDAERFDQLIQSWPE